MTKRIRNLFVAILSCLFVAVACVGMVSLAKADVTVITMTGTAEANVKTAEKSGLRFSAVFDKSEYQTLTEGKDAKVGMIIVPTDHLNAAISQGLDFTIEKLSTYAPFEGYAFYDYASTVKDNGDEYQFWMTVPNISGANYNRDFSARAFIEISEGNSVSYVYADYDEENARNVYEVAYNAYTEGAIEDQTGKNIAKTFIDGVAVLEYDQESGKVVIANNIDGVYTSPYTIEKDGLGNYVVNGKTPLALTYNESRYADLTLKDTTNNIAISTMLSKGATFGENNSVTLDGVRPPHSGASSGVGVVGTKGTEDSYIAFEGNYGVGTYVEFTFTENNMPYVNLFADTIDGWLGCTDSWFEEIEEEGNITQKENGIQGKGIVIINGIVDAGNSNSSAAEDDRAIRCDQLTVWGPNRYTGDGAGKGTPMFSFAEYPLLTQNGLNADQSGDVYKYRVGTYYDILGNICLDIQLTNAENNEQIYHIEQATTLTEGDVENGNIIVLAPMKGLDKDSEFSYSLPKMFERLENISAKGVVSHDYCESTVTLTGVRPAHSGSGTGVGGKGTEDSYIAFEGEYGVGNYVEFEFSGNNMPYLNLFSNTVDGFIGNNNEGKEGIVIVNGIVDRNNGVKVDGEVYERPVRCDQFNVWGPNRYTTTAIDGADQTGKKPLISLSYSEYPYLTQKGLKEDTSGRTYKYKVGTYYDVIGNLILDIKLSDASNDQIIYDIQEVLELGTTEIGTGNIIALAPMKGLNQDSTFKFSAPVKEKSGVKPAITASGAAVNTDGTVTLTGVQPRSGLGGDVRLVSNSYVGFDSAYGLNTYVDFYYKGNNMPQITFFANEIDGCMNYQYSSGDSAVKKYGILLLNGLVSTYSSDGNDETKDDHAFDNALKIFGPNKYDVNNKYNGTTGARVAIIDYAELTQSGAVSDRQYKYTVGTYEGEDGLIFVDITLSYLNGEKYEQLYHIEQSTTLTVDEMKTVLGITDGELAGKIIAYATLKGASNNTTFRFSKPYPKTNG